MPEGDTIRRLADSVSRRFAGQQVKSSLFRHPRLATVDLSGTQLIHADAYGKHLLMRFSNGFTVHVHLKMSGSIYFRFPRNVSSSRRKFEIEFASGWVTGIDIPILEMLRTKDELRVIGHLGPDICGHYDHGEGVRRLSQAGSIPLTQALLDQSIVAGFGNIYAVETPFVVGINPYTTIDKLDGVSGLLGIAVGLIRANARFGPQNTTGKGMRRTNHWVLSSRIFRCKVCGSRLKRVAAADSPWKRRHAWCVQCQPEGASVVDLQRAARLLALHPCRQIVNLPAGTLVADVSKPVHTQSLTANEDGRKTMR